VNLVIAEPFFHTSHLPWHNIQLWYRLQRLKDSWGILSPNAKRLPVAAKILAVGVEFKDLWKIRAPLGDVLGFDLYIRSKKLTKDGEDRDRVCVNCVCCSTNFRFMLPEFLCDFNFFSTF
jgi:protein arginine N-methyltransferase 7